MADNPTPRSGAWPVVRPERAATSRARHVSRRWPLISGLVAVALACALGALIATRDHGPPLAIDVEWMRELIENREPVWQFVALSMDFLGRGLVAILIVPALVIAALLAARRPWAATYFLVASVVTGGLVQLLKQLFGRVRPDNLLTNLDFGSFPSGHVANAATMAAVLAILVPRVWVWIAGSVYTLLMMISRTYLGAHWLTDTLGALLLGVGVAIVAWAPLAAKLDGERALAQERRSRSAKGIAP